MKISYAYLDNTENVAIVKNGLVNCLQVMFRRKSSQTYGFNAFRSKGARSSVPKKGQKPWREEIEKGCAYNKSRIPAV